MKINFDQTFKGVAQEGPSPLTLGMVCVNALNAVPPSQREPLSFEAAVRRGTLALKLLDAGEQEVSVDDCALIRTLLAVLWTPLVVVQAAAMLDPSDPAKAN